MKVLFTVLIILIILSGCTEPPVDPPINPPIDPPINGNDNNGNQGNVADENNALSVSGGFCHTIEEPTPEEKEYALPEGCSIDFAMDSWGGKYTVICDDNRLEDYNCLHNDDEFRYISLTQTNLGGTKKTLIECLNNSYYSKGDEYVRSFNYHPVTQFLTHFVGYDSETNEFEKITTKEQLFTFLAPFTTQQEVWEATSLSTSNNLICGFDGKGYYSDPDSDYYGEWHEEFLVPPQEIKRPRIEKTANGFEIDLLLNNQGCPCFIGIYELSFNLTKEGIISDENQQYVYRAEAGCLC